MAIFTPEDTKSTFDFTSAPELLDRQRASSRPPYPYGEPSLTVREPGHGYREARNFGYWIDKMQKGLYPAFNMAEDARYLSAIKPFLSHIDSVKEYKQYRLRGGDQKMEEFETWIPRLEKLMGVPLEDYEYTENDRKRDEWYQKAIRTDVDEMGQPRDSRTGEPVIMEPFPFDAIDDAARNRQPKTGLREPVGQSMLDDLYGRKPYDIGSLG